MLIPFSTLQREYGVNPRGVLHLGAHLGEEAQAYADAGVAQVVWVEGNPALMNGLRAHLAAFAGQRAVEAVIADQDDAATDFRVASFSMSSSILAMTGHLQHYPSIVEIATLACQSITVDSLLRQEHLDGADYDMLNIDLEGAELLALHGAKNLLPHIKHVYAEVYFENLYENCARVEELDEFLADYGFDRVVTEDAYYEGLFKGFGDALYSKV